MKFPPSKKRLAKTNVYKTNIKLIKAISKCSYSTKPELRAQIPIPTTPIEITTVATPITTPAIANPRFLEDVKRGAIPRPVPTRLTNT